MKITTKPKIAFLSLSVIVHLLSWSRGAAAAPFTSSCASGGSGCDVYIEEGDYQGVENSGSSGLLNSFGNVTLQNWDDGIDINLTFSGQNITVGNNFHAQNDYDGNNVTNFNNGSLTVNGNYVLDTATVNLNNSTLSLSSTSLNNSSASGTNLSNNSILSVSGTDAVSYSKLQGITFDATSTLKLSNSASILANNTSTYTLNRKVELNDTAAINNTGSTLRFANTSSVTLNNSSKINNGNADAGVEEVRNDGTLTLTGNRSTAGNQFISTQDSILRNNGTLNTSNLGLDFSDTSKVINEAGKSMTVTNSAISLSEDASFSNEGRASGTNGTVTFNNSSLNLSGNSTFLNKNTAADKSNGGVVNFNNSSSLNLSGSSSFTNNYTVSFSNNSSLNTSDNAKFVNNAILNLAGKTLKLSGSGFSVDNVGYLENNGTINLNNSSNFTLDQNQSFVLGSLGTLSFDGTSSLNLSSGSTLTNSGTASFSSGNLNAVSSNSKFINNGTTSLSGFVLGINGQGFSGSNLNYLENNSVLNLSNSSSLILNQNQTFNNGSGKTLSFDNSSLTLNDNSEFTNNGTLSLVNNSVLTLNDNSKFVSNSGQNTSSSTTTINLNDSSHFSGKVSGFWGTITLKNSSVFDVVRDSNGSSFLTDPSKPVSITLYDDSKFNFMEDNQNASIGAVKNFTLNDRSVLNAYSKIVLRYSGGANQTILTLNDNSVFNAYDTFTLNNASEIILNNNSRLNAKEGFKLEDNSISAVIPKITLNDNAVLENSGDANIGHVSNSGLVVHNGAIEANGNSTIINKGNLSIKSTDSSSTLNDQSKIINEGSLIVSKGTLTSNDSSSVVNKSNAQTIVTSSGVYNNNSSLDIQTGGSLILDLNSTFNNRGTVSVNNGGFYINNSTFNNLSGGSVDVNNSDFEMNNSTFNNQAGGTTNITDSRIKLNNSNLNSAVAGETKIINSKVNLSGNSNLGSNVSVDSNSTISSSGSTSYSDNTVIHGIMDVSSGNATIKGLLDMRSGSTLSVGIDSTSNANDLVVTKLTVAGVAIINPGVKLSIDLGENPSLADVVKKGSQKQYKIIENVDLDPADAALVTIDPTKSTSISVISDSNIKVAGMSNNKRGWLNFSTVADSRNLYLTVGMKKPANVTGNNRFREVYNYAMSDLADSGKLKQFQDYLLEIDPNDNSKIESSLSQLALQDQNGLNIQTFTSIMGSAGTIESRVDSFNMASLDQEGVASGDEIPVKGIWGQVFGGSAKQGKIKSNDGYNSNLQGFAFGADRDFELFEQDVTLGTSFSYSSSSVKTADRSKKTGIDSYQFNLYANKNFGEYFVDGIIGLAINEYASSRSISSVSSMATADYDGKTYLAKARVGTIKDLGNGFDFIPKLSFSMARNKINSYSEEGAGNLNLSIGGSKSDFVELGLGTDFGYNTQIKSHKVRPEIRAFYGYDLAGGRTNSNTSFVGQGGSFNSENVKIDQSRLDLGFGVKMYQTDDLVIDVDYTHEMRRKYSSDTGSLQARYNF